MKKIISFVLILTLACSMSMTSFASGAISIDAIQKDEIVIKTDAGPVIIDMIVDNYDANGNLVSSERLTNEELTLLIEAVEKQTAGMSKMAVSRAASADSRVKSIHVDQSSSVFKLIYRYKEYVTGTGWYSGDLDLVSTQKQNSTTWRGFYAGFIWKE